ncbi:MAG: hypothetical protein KA392_10560 [Candidatus Obscuribacter sp.]|nr:hypothetical protein [Candidatus Obscuribacter sp.]MBP6592618.1 hypothetical protein [Candidatus Obscuribacter sp.]
MKFYFYEPQICGDFGENTVYAPPDKIDVLKFHYEFSSWPQDDMQWVGYCFMGTDQLKQAFEAVTPALTGIEFGPVEVTGDDQEFERVWRQGRPDSALGKWHWFKITGQPGVHDFGQAYRSMDLVVSERVIEVLKNFTVINPARKIQEWTGEIARK